MFPKEQSGISQVKFTHQNVLIEFSMLFQDIFFTLLCTSVPCRNAMRCEDHFTINQAFTATLPIARIGRLVVKWRHYVSRDEIWSMTRPHSVLNKIFDQSSGVASLMIKKSKDINKVWINFLRLYFLSCHTWSWFWPEQHCVYCLKGSVMGIWKKKGE